MATEKTLERMPCAGIPHVRLDEGEVASAATPRRGSLLCKSVIYAAVLAVAAPVVARTVDSACWASQSTWHVGPVEPRSGSGAENDVSYEPRVWMVAESAAGDLETKPKTGLCIMFR